MKNKKIHILIEVEKQSTHISFYFKGALVEQLYALNSELDLLKGEILDRIKDAPKEFEIQEFDDEEES